MKALQRNRLSRSSSNASRLSHRQAARVFEMDDIQVVESKPLLEIPVRILNSCAAQLCMITSQWFVFTHMYDVGKMFAEFMAANENVSCQKSC